MVSSGLAFDVAAGLVLESLVFRMQVGISLQSEFHDAFGFPLTATLPQP